MKGFEKYSDDIRCNEIECGDNMILCRDLSCKECIKIRKEAWKAALEMVLTHRKPYYDIEDKKVVATDSDIIYKELEEE